MEEEFFFRPTPSVDELDYFKDDEGEVRYNELCETCKLKCKQSFRASVVNCSKRKEIRKK